MAKPTQYELLKKGVNAWNRSRENNPLSDIDLSGANLAGVYLCGADLSDSNLANADLSNVDLSAANLKNARLRKANLSWANLSGADLRNADAQEANLQWATLCRTNLSEINLSGAKLNRGNASKANLSRAILQGVDLGWANLSGANMNRANLIEADMTRVDLSQADLTGTDLRSAALQHARLDEASASGIKLWETQRAGWSIKGITCDRAYWDEYATLPTAYAPGEFEKLYSTQTCIELFYPEGVSTFELNTLPALLHHLASLHAGTSIRLKSVEETGGGAKISISVGDADTETVEKIKSDAMQVHQAQLALRDNEILRLETEKKYLESFVSERLIKAMLTATTQQNVFNAPVYGVALSSGTSSAVVNQTVNDTAGLLALLDKIIERRRDLDLPQADASRLEAEAQSAKAELEKPRPSPSILSRSLKFVQEMAGEAVKKAAGKIGEQAVSADWHSLLRQLDEFVRHIK